MHPFFPVVAITCCLLYTREPGIAALVYYRPTPPIVAGQFLPDLNIAEVDIDLDGQPEIHFATGYFLSGLVTRGTNRVTSLLNDDIGGYVAPVSLGEIIGASGAFQAAEWHHSSDNIPPNVEWLLGLAIGECAAPAGCGGLMQYTDGFIGLEFNRPDGTHYGWIHFRGHSVLDPRFAGQGGTVLEWAWESDPGVPILAGAVPEPAGWMCLGGAWLAWCLRRVRGPVAGAGK